MLNFLPFYNDNAASGSITITPKAPYVVGYVDPAKYDIAEEVFEKDYDLIRNNDVRSIEKISSSKTFKMAKIGINSLGMHVLAPVNEAGDIAVFGFGDSASQASLKGAGYSVVYDNGDTEAGEIEYLNLFTEDQLRSGVVPYIELQQDPAGNFKSLVWRGVNASDPATAVKYTGNTDAAMGVFRHFGNIDCDIILNDGTVISGWDRRQIVPTKQAGEPLEGVLELSDFDIDGNILSGAAPVPMNKIACVRVQDKDDTKWIFYAAKEQGTYNSAVQGGVSKTWSGGGKLVITIDVEFSKFVRILINGVVLAPSHYTKRSGSTIIEIDEAYLKTLGKGTHKMSVEFDDGTAEITLTTGDGQTGGGSGGGCAAGLFAPLAIAALAAIRRRSR